jgi:hypothetical protein
MSAAFKATADELANFLLCEAEDEMDRAIREIEAGRPVLARYTFEAAEAFVAAASMIQAIDATKH